MKWLVRAYTARFNRQQKPLGYLRSGRYKVLVAAVGDAFDVEICDYH